jgi:peptidoglycan/xylan/chitin deacetylase (PgdA/CDA1 family)
MTNAVSIIMYHYVRDLAASRYPKIKGLDLPKFRDQVRFLKENFQIISTEQLIDALDRQVPLPAKAALLTFDDGYIDHYTNVFPILKAEKLPAFFSMPGKILAEKKLLDVNKIHFILASQPIEQLLPAVFARLDHYRGQEHPILPNQELFAKLAKDSRFDSPEVIFVKRLLQVELPEPLRNLIVADLFAECIPLAEDAFVQELYMSLDQVRLMQQEGMTFGIHGYDHYWMNRLSPEDLKRDITMALQTFAGVVDPASWICCYPYGSCSQEVVAIIKPMGAVAGFNTVVNQAHLGHDDRYLLPRFDTNDFPPVSTNYLSYPPRI